MLYPLTELYLIDTWVVFDNRNMVALGQSEKHLKAGSLSLVWDIDEVPNLSKNDAVAIRVKQDAADAGTIVFCGKITNRKNINDFNINYTASNILHDLQHLPMVVDGETKFTLFRDSQDSPITVGEQIAAALDYAIAQGVAVTYDQDELDALDLDMPATDVSNITVYDVIKKALVYCPNIIVAVEYAAPGSDQTLRFTEQSDLPSVTYDSSNEVGTFNADALYDRQVEGVVLTYEWPDEKITDSYGATTGVNVLRQNIPMQAPSSATFTALKIHTGAPDQAQWSFWAKANAIAGGYSGPYSWDVQYDWDDLVIGAQYNNAGGTHIILKDTYDGLDSLIKEEIGMVWDAKCSISQIFFQRLSGTSTHWTGQLTSIEPESGYWWPYYAFTPPSIATLVDQGAGGGVDVEYEVSMTVIADPDPTGLAEQLYNILSPLQYDGQVVRYDDLTTANGICSILRRLNIAGAENDLETMASIIQQCSFDYMTDLQTIKFGVADHLEPQDFMALLRANPQSLGNLRIA